MAEIVLQLLLRFFCTSTTLGSITGRIIYIERNAIDLISTSNRQVLIFIEAKQNLVTKQLLSENYVILGNRVECVIVILRASMVGQGRLTNNL